MNCVCAEAKNCMIRLKKKIKHCSSSKFVWYKFYYPKKMCLTKFVLNLSSLFHFGFEALNHLKKVTI